MSPRKTLFGFWLPVTDEASARYATRMAGLPVLLIGASAALPALMVAVQPQPDLAFIGWSALAAVLLTVIAFRICAGHAAWLPFALVLFAVTMILNARASHAIWTVVAGTSYGGSRLISWIQIALSWIVPLFCAALMLSGLRGWWWLRSNGGRANF